MSRGFTKKYHKTKHKHHEIPEEGMTVQRWIMIDSELFAFFLRLSIKTNLMIIKSEVAAKRKTSAKTNEVTGDVNRHHSSIRFVCLPTRRTVVVAVVRGATKC